MKSFDTLMLALNIFCWSGWFSAVRACSLCWNPYEGGKRAEREGLRWKGQTDVSPWSQRGTFLSDRMPPVVGVNVVLEGQRCADELILGMSRGAWRQRSRVHWWSGGRGGGSFGKWVSECRSTINQKSNLQSMLWKWTTCAKLESFYKPTKPN